MEREALVPCGPIAVEVDHRMAFQVSHGTYRSGDILWYYDYPVTVGARVFELRCVGCHLPCGNEQYFLEGLQDATSMQGHIAPGQLVVHLAAAVAGQVGREGRSDF